MRAQHGPTGAREYSWLFEDQGVGVQGGEGVMVTGMLQEVGPQHGGGCSMRLGHGQG